LRSTCYRHLSIFDQCRLLFYSPCSHFYLSSPHHVTFASISLALVFPFLSPVPPPLLDANRCLSLSGERIPPHSSQAPESRPAPPPRSGPRCHLAPLLLFIGFFFSSSPIVCWLLLVRFPCLFESGCTASCSRAGVRILPRLPNRARARFASNVLLVSSNVCFSRSLEL
jgi:hypothetical protein